MAKIVILGAGIAGHTAATLLKKHLKQRHEIVVVSPNSQWNWIPSNIWVGVGVMKKESVLFPLAPVYERQKIEYVQAKALSIHPEGSEQMPRSHVIVERTSKEGFGKKEALGYDFLINATGPKLNFEATEGLGPENHSLSVCSASHADHAAQEFKKCIARMKAGQKQVFVVGTGHGTCTCQGAAFEYVFNLEHELNRHGVRELGEVIYITNEFELGDFGMGGMHIRRGGYVVPSQLFAESLFVERGIKWIKRAHVQKVQEQSLSYETIDGEEASIEFDFAMLLPPFRGVELKAFSKDNTDISNQMFAANGFMFVDADYQQKPYECWSPEDWPSTYQSPLNSNIFAAGIAFAPPHPVSKPFKSPSGTPIFAAPPRTGMTAGIMGRSVALSISDMVEGKSDHPSHPTPFAEMGAACVASAGTGFFSGSAASITMYPIVPDFDKYPYGRDLDYTTGEIGLAGHWIKRVLHHMFIYKAKCRPGWSFIPE